MRSTLRIAEADPRLLAGVVEAHGVTVGPASPDLDAAVDALLALRADEEFPPTPLRDAVRSLLRAAGYKPSGRGKPASEYLAGAARRGAFPRISNVVDAANRYSLLTGFPISLLDLDLALTGADALEIRPGRADENYVFNGSGQEIDVAGLLCVARVGGACIGNAVKDSLETRTSEATRNLVGVIWATRDACDEDVVARMAAQLAEQLRVHGSAEDVVSTVLAT